MMIEDEKRRADKIGEISDFTSGSKRGSTIKLARNVCRVCHAERVGPIYNGNCATRNGKCQMHISRAGVGLSGTRGEGSGVPPRLPSQRRKGSNSFHYIFHFHARTLGHKFSRWKTSLFRHGTAAAAAFAAISRLAWPPP